MARLVRCAACGYVMPEERLGDVCPACGALRKVFAPYEDPLSERRRRLLDLDLHPIIVHFPEAFAASLLVLAILPLFLTGRAEELFVCTAKIVAVFTPFLAAAAFATGVLDGRTRFRRIDRSPFLRRKILLGSLLLAFSVGLALLLWLAAGSTVGWTVASIVVAAAAFYCSFRLGLIGKQLLNAAFPGK